MAVSPDIAAARAQARQRRIAARQRLVAKLRRIAARKRAQEAAMTAEQLRIRRAQAAAAARKAQRGAEGRRRAPVGRRVAAVSPDRYAARQRRIRSIAASIPDESGVTRADIRASRDQQIRSMAASIADESAVTRADQMGGAHYRPAAPPRTRQEMRHGGARSGGVYDTLFGIGRGAADFWKRDDRDPQIAQAFGGDPAPTLGVFGHAINEPGEALRMWGSGTQDFFHTTTFGVVPQPRTLYQYSPTQREDVAHDIVTYGTTLVGAGGAVGAAGRVVAPTIKTGVQVGRAAGVKAGLREGVKHAGRGAAAPGTRKAAVKAVGTTTVHGALEVGGDYGLETGLGAVGIGEGGDLAKSGRTGIHETLIDVFTPGYQGASRLRRLGSRIGHSQVESAAAEGFEARDVLTGGDGIITDEERQRIKIAHAAGQVSGVVSPVVLKPVFKRLPESLGGPAKALSRGTKLEPGSPGTRGAPVTSPKTGKGLFGAAAAAVMAAAAKRAGKAAPSPTVDAPTTSSPTADQFTPNVSPIGEPTPATVTPATVTPTTDVTPDPTTTVTAGTPTATPVTPTPTVTGGSPTPTVDPTPTVVTPTTDITPDPGPTPTIKGPPPDPTPTEDPTARTIRTDPDPTVDPTPTPPSPSPTPGTPTPSGLPPGGLQAGATGETPFAFVRHGKNPRILEQEEESVLRYDVDTGEVTSKVKRVSPPVVVAYDADAPEDSLRTAGHRDIRIRKGQVSSRVRGTRVRQAQAVTPPSPIHPGHRRRLQRLAQGRLP